MGLPIRETRIVAQALLAISDFRHAESRTAGAWLQSQACLRGIPLRLPSTLRGGLKQLLRNQGSLRSLILVFLSLRDLGNEGVTMGLPPQALPEGDSPQTPFFASRWFEEGFTFDFFMDRIRVYGYNREKIS